MRRNFKKLTAVALTAAMTMGSAMTVFAAPTSGDVMGEIESSGGFEGGEIPYLPISVTLPTVPTGAIDYIADPNDLITSTLNASGDAINNVYANSEFSSSTGIYFKTSDASGDIKAQYTETSKPMTITNENAQNIKLTVKVAESQAASGDVAYSDDATFASGDTARKLYLAVTDGETTKALDASGDASFTTEIKGNADNYVPKHDGSKYSYELKADATGWASASYRLTGAVNKNAEWKDGIGFPNVKITWSWEEGAVEKDSAPSVGAVTYSKSSAQDLVIPYSVGAGESGANALTDVLLQFDGSTFHSIKGTWNSATTFASSFTISGSSITISKDYLTYVSNGTHDLHLIFDNDENTVISTTVTVQ